MEAVETSGLKRNSLVKIDSCLLHLQGHTVSDILDGSRDRLCRLSLKGTRNQCKINLFDWSIQNSPDNKNWALLRRAIRITFPH